MTLGRLFGGLSIVLALSGCGGNDGPPLSAEGSVGRQVAADSGCMACHGDDGSGGVGPAWIGLADSMVELDDGTTVVADDAYLARSITDPDESRVATYTLRMPSNSLGDADVAAVVAYIRDLK